MNRSKKNRTKRYEKQIDKYRNQGIGGSSADDAATKFLKARGFSPDGRKRGL